MLLNSSMIYIMQYIILYITRLYVVTHFLLYVSEFMKYLRWCTLFCVRYFNRDFRYGIQLWSIIYNLYVSRVYAVPHTVAIFVSTTIKVETSRACINSNGVWRLHQTPQTGPCWLLWLPVLWPYHVALSYSFTHCTRLALYYIRTMHCTSSQEIPFALIPCSVLPISTRTHHTVYCIINNNIPLLNAIRCDIFTCCLWLKMSTANRWQRISTG